MRFSDTCKGGWSLSVSRTLTYHTIYCTSTIRLLCIYLYLAWYAVSCATRSGLAAAALLSVCLSLASMLDVCRDSTSDAKYKFLILDVLAALRLHPVHVRAVPRVLRVRLQSPLFHCIFLSEGLGLVSFDGFLGVFSVLALRHELQVTVLVHGLRLDLGVPPFIFLNS